jgi:Flp pilus assembly protein TadD
LFQLQWARGRFEEGVAEARRALGSDPLSAYVTAMLGMTLAMAGRREEAIEQGHAAVERDPESFSARWGLGIALHWAGRFAEAVDVLQGAAAMSNRLPSALASLSATLADWGRPAPARLLHRELLERSSRGYVPFGYLALSAVAAGEREEAVELARRAWADREPPFILLARHFPDFRPLRDDPRFVAILREMG